jgi:hypothetical protein
LTPSLLHDWISESKKLERPLFFFDTVRTMARRPYPASEGMRNVQRLLKKQNPRIAEVNIDDLVDSRFIRKLDESVFLIESMVTPDADCMRGIKNRREADLQVQQPAAT